MKLRFLSPYVRAKWIALLPLIKPTTGETAYFSMIEIIMYVNMIQHEVTFFDPALLLQGQLAEHISEMLASVPHKVPSCGTWE